ncbi:helix-turn-helix domain-containing protein [Arthrobacter sp. LS16]|uniref:helix-turn-helix domain-containing protein n=1 Tax=Arthrobacter sp. 'calajunan' TaxID=1690248 RepID=UPI003C76AF2E
MRISYDKLWKLFFDKDTSKNQLQTEARISSSTMGKIGRGGIVQTKVLMRIRETLGCDIQNIVVVVKNEGV